MNRKAQARQFHELHIKGAPCILYNIWDAGSALAVEIAGAKAIATGSYSVAAAHGYDDGEAIPLELLERIVERIGATVGVPITVDFEGGFAVSPGDVADNVSRMLDVGAIGINFEDRVVDGEGLHDITAQSARIQAIRDMADQRDLPLFINARTDLFLQSEPSEHSKYLSDAIARARSYRAAGANGFFVPGLIDRDLIIELCEAVELPVNIMMMEGAPSVIELDNLGISRVSFGPGPYFSTMTALSESAKAVYLPEKNTNGYKS